MELNERILDELVAIRKMLTILSQDKLADFNNSLKEKYLSTPQREKMYEMFDGTKGLKEIGTEVKVSAEAVRQFAVSLEKAGLIEYVVINAKTRYPKRLF